MASNTATARYASRSSVYGSNAYKLDRTNAAPQRRPSETPVPVKKPEARPSTKTAPGTVRRAETRVETRTSQRTAVKAQKAYGISLFAIVGFLAVGVMMILVLLAYVSYNEVSYETVQLQAQLDELNEQERVLRIAYEGAFDVNEVEEYATTVLGMSKPSEDQISTLETMAEDKITVIGSDDAEDSKLGGLATFLASLMEYFK
jgi:hypothetical protein